MNLKPKRSQAKQQQPQQPHAQADISELQAWATGHSDPPAPRAGVSVQRDDRGSASSGLAGHPLAPKALIVAGVVIVGYLAIMLIVHVLMMLMMILGGIAAVYAAYRIGFWRGRKSVAPVRTTPWPGSGRRRD